MRQGIVLCQDGEVKQEAGPEGGRGRELSFEDSRDLAQAGRTAQLEQSESRGVPSTRHQASQAQDQV